MLSARGGTSSGRARGAWPRTGAASGLGEEAARRLAERGEALSALDRDADGLVRVPAGAGPRARRAVADVTGETSTLRSLRSPPPIDRRSRHLSAEEVIDARFAGGGAPAWIGLVDRRSEARWRAGRVAPAVLDRVVRAAR